VIPLARVGSGFYSLVCIAWGWRCLSNANRHFLGRRSVSLTTYRPFATSRSLSFSPSVNWFLSGLGWEATFLTGTAQNWCSFLSAWGEWCPASYDDVNFFAWLKLSAAFSAAKLIFPLWWGVLWGTTCLSKYLIYLSLSGCNSKTT
jgi:hypothetical protein